MRWARRPASTWASSSNCSMSCCMRTVSARTSPDSSSQSIRRGELRAVSRVVRTLATGVRSSWAASRSNGSSAWPAALSPRCPSAQVGRRPASSAQREPRSRFGVARPSDMLHGPLARASLVPRRSVGRRPEDPGSRWVCGSVRQVGDRRDLAFAVTSAGNGDLSRQR